MLALPVDSLLPDIVAALQRSPNLIVEAPPGAGKTTRVPPALLDAGFGNVIVLQPRRIAARLAARRVAFERGETLGETVGYQVRFEQIAGPKTRLRFLTEGVLTRKLLSDPELRDTGVVVLDEFHERHMEGDLALALLRRLQSSSRPDLRLVIMSATLAGERISAALGGCPVLRSEGRLYPLEVEYTPASSSPLEQRVAEAVERLIQAQPSGDILVFLPGAYEIRRCERALASLAARRNLLVTPLHGDLSPEEQDRAIEPAPQRKVILSTNVAESSVTIEGVRAVVDSGLHRVAKDSPWTGLPRIEVARIARASAEQRAGRAGRTAPGRVIRLYPQDDFLRRPEHDEPEITRRELTQACLDLHAAGVGGALELEWLDAPPREAVDKAEALLHRLRALDAAGRITALGRRMALLPLHPRLAALALAADELGAMEEGCLAAAALSVGERLPETPPHDALNDISVLIERRIEGRLRQTAQQIRRMLSTGRSQRKSSHADPLRLALLRAFPDRVARRRKGAELRMAGGIALQQAANSTVRKADLLVAVEVEERPDQGLPVARLVCAIEPEWLLDEFAELVTDREAVEWNRATERVDRVSSLLYDGLAIEESRGGVPDAAQAAELLTAKAIEAGLHRFTEMEDLDALRARVAFALQHAPLPAIDDDRIAAALRQACLGLASLRELEAVTREGGFLRILLHSLSKDAARLLDDVAPVRIKLPSGRNAKVHYADGQTPWTASRLQDFFGMRETPRIARGQVNLVVHLLAPSQRPVQTTQDLAGFWERLYPQLRKELSRRYPRHAWPEDPYQVQRG